MLSLATCRRRGEHSMGIFFAKEKWPGFKCLILLLCNLIFLEARANILNVEVNDVNYSIDTNTNTATVSHSSVRGSIAIPFQIQYEGVNYNVISVGAGAFSGCSDLTSIELPYGIISIEKNAFYGCVFLASIDLPNSVKSIGESAFANCKSLNSIKLPEGLTLLDEYAFVNCISLTGIKLPNSLSQIAHYAFENCIALESVDFPNNLTKIGRSAFHNCTSLVSIKLPDSLKELGGYEFQGCTSLSNIEFPSTMVYILDNVFEGCSSLTSLELPESLTSIGHSAFRDCASLESVKFPNGLTTISHYAFYNCKSLTTLEFPDGLNFIGENAFHSCGSLTNIYFSDNLTTIRSNAFSYCRSLESVNFPDALTFIGAYAFEWCDKLKKIEFPKNLNTINSYAFRYCKNLVSVDIPMGNCIVGIDAFKYCDNLKYISLGVNNYGNEGSENIIKINDGAFSDTPNLRAVFVGSLGLNDKISLPQEDAFASNRKSGVEPIFYVPIPSSDKYKEFLRYNCSAYGSFATCSAVYSGQAPKLAPEFSSNLPSDFRAEISSIDSSDNINVGTAEGTCVVTFVSGDINTFELMFSYPYTITPAPLQISAPTIVREYRQENPELELVFDGFKNNETKDVLTAQPIVSIDADQYSPVGEYVISLSGAEAQNYDISYIPGKLTIVKANQKIEWDAERTEFNPNEELTLNASASSGLAVKYEVSDPNVAKIEGNILVFRSVGTVTVTAKQDGNENYHAAEDVVKTFNIKAIPVKNIILDIETLSINVGKEHQFVATITPDDATNKTITWASSDPEVASINENGLLKAIKEGKTSISATANDGSEVQGSCEVIVTGIISGIDGIETNERAYFVINNGVLKLFNIPSKTSIHVVTLDGITIYHGNSSEIQLSSGLYILTIGNKAYKIKM